MLNLPAVTIYCLYVILQVICWRCLSMWTIMAYIYCSLWRSYLPVWWLLNYRSSIKLVFFFIHNSIKSFPLGFVSIRHYVVREARIKYSYIYYLPVSVNIFWIYKTKCGMFMWWWTCSYLHVFDLPFLILYLLAHSLNNRYVNIC